MNEAMSDERLAELKAYHAEYGINGTADGDSIISELLDEAERARKREAEIGETEVEWGYWHDDEFNISDRQFSAGDIRYYLKESGRPVERRIVGKWCKVEQGGA